MELFMLATGVRMKPGGPVICTPAGGISEVPEVTVVAETRRVCPAKIDNSSLRSISSFLIFHNSPSARGFSVLLD